MKSKNVLLGLLAGFAAGALVGILYAPDKGSNTRGKITKKGKDYMDGMKEGFNTFVDKVAEKFDEVSGRVDDVKEEVDNLAEKAKEKVEEVKNEVKPLHSSNPTARQ